MKKILFILLMLVSAFTNAMPTVFETATKLVFQAPTENTDGSPLTDLAGFKVYWSLESGGYNDANSQYFPGATLTEILLQDINIPDGSYYFVLTAVTDDGRESEFSNSGTAKKLGSQWYKDLNAKLVPVAPFNILIQ